MDTASVPPSSEVLPPGPPLTIPEVNPDSIVLKEKTAVNPPPVPTSTAQAQNQPCKRKTRRNNKNNTISVNNTVRNNANAKSTNVKTIENNTGSVSNTIRNNTNAVENTNIKAITNGKITEAKEAESEAKEAESEAKEAESETTEIKPEPIKPSVGDPSLPHLLKIGQQGYAEYIELANMPFNTSGGFNQFQTGNRIKELQKLYNVSSNDQYIAMQKAFGVENMIQDPPILDYIAKKCVPSNFILVRKALEYRVKTLETTIMMKRGTMSVKPDERRLVWLKDILKNTESLKTCSAAAATMLPNTIKDEEELPQEQGSKCPCLEDLNLLRDLIYVIVLLQGTADPEVKKQLQNITLDKLLNSVQKNNIKGTKLVLGQIIDVLKSRVEKQANVKINDKTVEEKITQDLLKKIYTAVAGNDSTVSDKLTVEIVIEVINKIINELKSKLSIVSTPDVDTPKVNVATAQSELNTLKTNLSESNKKMQELLQQIQKIPELESKALQLNSTIKELDETKSKLKELEENKKAAGEKHDSELVNLQNELARAKATILQIEKDAEANKESSSEMATKLSTAESEIKRLEAEIAARGVADSDKNIEYNKAKSALQEQIAELERASGEKNSKASEQSGKIDNLQATVALKNTEIDSLKETVNTKEAELASLKEKVDKLNTITVEKEKFKEDIANKNTQIEALQKELNELRPKLEELQAKSVADDTRKQELESALEAAQQGVSSDATVNENGVFYNAVDYDLKQDSTNELLKELDSLKTKLQEQETLLEQYKTDKDETKKRLENLLSYFIISPDIGNEAEKFLKGDANVQKDIRRNLCDFFKYLTGLINLQSRRINASTLPPRVKNDIFTIFQKVPEYDETSLLNDISNLFQELFVKVGKTSAFPKDLKLQGEYTELMKTMGNYTITNGDPFINEYRPAQGFTRVENPKLEILLKELGSFGYLSNVYLEKSGDSFVIKSGSYQLLREFTHNNRNHTTPLVIIGIKMIQLLSKILNEKYASLLEQCKTKPTDTDAEAVTEIVEVPPEDIQINSSIYTGI
jgi:hypothetical protein